MNVPNNAQEMLFVTNPDDVTTVRPDLSRHAMTHLMRSKLFKLANHRLGIVCTRKHQRMHVRRRDCQNFEWYVELSAFAYNRIRHKGLYFFEKNDRLSYCMLRPFTKSLVFFGWWRIVICT